MLMGRGEASPHGKERKMFTENELRYLYDMLDNVNVSGIEQKNMVLGLMVKVINELQRVATPTVANVEDEKEE